MFYPNYLLFIIYYLLFKIKDTIKCLPEFLIIYYLLFEIKDTINCFTRIFYYLLLIILKLKIQLNVYPNF
jgi:hypothetical protein